MAQLDKQYSDVMAALGVSPTGVKVYWALLELGKSSADAVALRAGTYKANAYQALEKLEGLGLVSTVMEGRKRQFMATDPRKLENALDEWRDAQSKRYDSLKTSLDSVMPRMFSAFGSVKASDEFEVYRGRKAYRALILDILKEKPSSWKGFGNLQVLEFFPLDFTKWFRSVKIRLFSTRTPEMEDRLKTARKTTDTQVQWLPPQMHMPIVWTVFGGNLLILIYQPDIIALRIRSNDIAQTFTNQFDYLWKNPTTPKTKP
jgi:predicted transcriptional regulator